jgi:protein TonB
LYGIVAGTNLHYNTALRITITFSNKISNMKPEIILRSDALDILFENRNKTYGAYFLRRNYPRHLLIALGCMGLMVTALWIFKPKYPRNLLGGPIFIIPDTKIGLVNPIEPTPPVKPLKPSTPRPPKATINNSNYVVVNDHEATKIPDQTELANNAISNLTRVGDPDDEVTGPEPSNGNGTQPAAPIEPPREEEPEIFDKTEIMPSFPGGAGALQRWLSRNLRPQDEQEPGQRIRVVVRFAVNAAGDIEQVHIIQAGGVTFDKEVLRVINKMPKWEPGQQNGRKVAVWFSIPVIFEMPEQ